MSQKEKWYASMRQKYNTDDEGVREIMRARGRVTGLPTGGFAHMKKNNPERLKQLSKEAIEKRWDKVKNQKQSPS